MNKQVNKLSKDTAAFGQLHILASFNSIIKKFPFAKNNENYKHSKSSELPYDVFRAFANYSNKSIVTESSSYIEDAANIQENNVPKFIKNDRVLVEDIDGKLQSRIFLHFVSLGKKALVEYPDHSYAECVDVKSLKNLEQNSDSPIQSSSNSNFIKKQIAEIDYFGKYFKFEIEKELEDEKVLLKHPSSNIRLVINKNKIISISSLEKAPFFQGEIVYASIGGNKKLFKFDHIDVNNKACLKDFISGYLFFTPLDKISKV